MTATTTYEDSMSRTDDGPGPTLNQDTQQYTITDPKGMTLQVDFAWTKFTNHINEKTSDGRLEPLYIQHFRPTKPQLRFEYATSANSANPSKSIIAAGTINSFSIGGECTIHGREIALKPLKRWRTQYNYLSHALLSGETSEPVPISWIANSSLKVWDFVCLNSHTQEPIAKFSVNHWALKQVGNFHFQKPREQISQELMDEVVVTGITLLYIMMTRMNNPLHIVGAAFAKPGKVEGSSGAADGVELAGHPEADGKVKKV